MERLVVSFARHDFVARVIRNKPVRVGHLQPQFYSGPELRYTQGRSQGSRPPLLTELRYRRGPSQGGHPPLRPWILPPASTKVLNRTFGRTGRGGTSVRARRLLYAKGMSMTVMTESGDVCRREELTNHQLLTTLNDTPNSLDNCPPSPAVHSVAPTMYLAPTYKPEYIFKVAG